MSRDQEAGRSKAQGSIDVKVELFKRSWLFSCLERNEIEEITPLTRPLRLAKGSFVFHEGEPAQFLYLVRAGKVKQYKVSSSGKIFTVNISSSGDALNVVSLFDGRGYFVSAQAMNEVSLFCIPREEFLSFVNNHPIVAMKIIPTLGRVINSTYERLTDFAGDTVHQRVLNVLYMLYSKFGTPLPVTREEIGDMAGTTKETAIRVLGRLRDLGIIDSRRGRIGILDEEKLRDICRCSYLTSGSGLGV